MSEPGVEPSTLVAAGVWVTDARRTLLAPTTVTVGTGEIVAVHGDPGHRHTLLALALGGRLEPAGGEVGIDGDYSAETLQRRVALVDVPGVSEPDDVSALTTIVGEELAMAGKPAGRSHVDHWLTSNGLRPYRDDRIEDLPAGLRTVAMARLAALRPGVRFLVLALPERNGIDPEAWLDDAIALADAGFGVVATMSTGIARHVERDQPRIRTVAFGNAEFHDPETDPEPDPEPGPETGPEEGPEEDDR
jgi:ABC-type transport system involved in cytochrome c biogenesis ATPase subunit